MTKQEVLDLMESSSTSQEWGSNCDKVKAAHDGGYPEYWYPEMIASGMLSRLSQGWGQPAGITVVAGGEETFYPAPTGP